MSSNDQIIGYVTALANKYENLENKYGNEFSMPKQDMNDLLDFVVDQQMKPVVKTLPLFDFPKEVEEHNVFTKFLRKIKRA